MYRTAKTDYQIDGKWILASSLINIIASIVLARPFGVNGIIIGTIMSVLVKR